MESELVMTGQERDLGHVQSSKKKMHQCAADMKKVNSSLGIIMKWRKNQTANIVMQYNYVSEKDIVDLGKMQKKATKIKWEVEQFPYEEMNILGVLGQKKGAKGGKMLEMWNYAWYGKCR